jgi:hypothetical protein
VALCDRIASMAGQEAMMSPANMQRCGTVSQGHCGFVVPASTRRTARDSQEDGFIAKILRQGGSKDVAVGAPVAVLVEEQSSIAAFKDYSGEQAAAPPKPKADAPKAKAPEAEAPKAEPAASGSSGGGSYPPHQARTRLCPVHEQSVCAAVKEHTRLRRRRTRSK